VQLQLIGDAFNISNLVGPPGTGAAFPGVINGPNFGQPGGRAGGVFGTGVPRAFQLAARLQF